MRYEYRLSKYDPRLRDELGYYTREEWTHFAQVGTIVGKHRVSARQYEKVEQAYLTSIREMLGEGGVVSLQLKRLRIIPAHRVRLAAWSRRRTIPLSLVEKISQLALRDSIEVQLASPRRAYVHFGYDFIVYLGLSCATPAAITAARQRGLFVEKCPSPYRAR